MSKGSLYYLIEEDGRSRQIVNGVVASLNKKTPLPYSPIGWKEILIVWERNVTRWAQVRNYTLPMGFVRDGAMILRNDMYMNNIDRKLFLLIQKLISRIDANFFYDRYEFLYKGEMDFSTFEDVPGEMRVNMNIMEGGISKLLKANENTKFLIPFDEDAINIVMDGIRITGIYKWTIIEHSTGASGALPTMVLASQEQKAPGIAVFDVNGGYTFSYNSIDASSIPYFLSDAIPPEGGTGTFTGVINMTNPDPEFPANIKLHIFNVITNTVRDIIDLFTGPEADVVNINQDVAVMQGDRFFLEIDEYIGQSELTFTIRTRFTQSVIKAFKPIDVYKKLCVKLGVSVDKAISTILSQSTIMLTPGDGIRGISADDVGIKTSINELFKAFDVYYMLGWAVRDTMRIERREDFFTNANHVNLGESADFKTVPADDLMYSSIKVGHAEQDIEDVNGKYDFNGYMIFTTPVKRSEGKQLDLTSPYKAGPYEIESIRSGLDGKTTTDNDRDNQVYAIACASAEDIINTTVSFVSTGNLMFFPNGVKLIAGMKISVQGSAAGNDREYNINLVVPNFIFQIAVLDVTPADEANIPVEITILSGQVYQLDRSIAVTAGVPDPESIFNVPISPKRLLQAHYRWISSWLYNYEPDKLVFQQANRNSDLVAGGVIEKADVPKSSMGAILFKPYYHELKTIVPVDLTSVMDDTPDVPFSTSWLGDEYTGFIWRGGISPNSYTPQTFKLLSGPENDLTRLIA